MVSRTDLISRRVHAATLSYHFSSFSFAVFLVSSLLRNTALSELIRLYASSNFGYSSKRIVARFPCVALHLSRLMASCLRRRVNASTSVSPLVSLGGSNRVFSLFGFLPRLRRTRQTLWGRCTDATPKLSTND